jgi:hypothetical protein
MKTIPVCILSLLVTGCSHSPVVDPFSTHTNAKTQATSMVRRSRTDTSTGQSELISAPHIKTKEGQIRAIFYLSPEDDRLYPELDEGALLRMDLVPNVDAEFSSALKKMLQNSGATFESSDSFVAIPYPRPAVMRFSRKAYPIVIESSEADMEKIAFRISKENRMMRIYDLTISRDSDAFSDPDLDRIRDIASGVNTQ